MRLQKGQGGSEEGFEINMTPMIDVIFQLVLFFVFSMKFMAFEGQINAFLPKNRGLDASVPNVDQELRQVTLFLEWDPAEGGAVLLRTMNYQPPGGGTPIPDYLFPMDRGVRGPLRAPDGSLRKETETTMLTPDGKKGGKVTYNYAAPDFTELETYLSTQKRDYEMKSGKGTGLRLTVNFQATVPWQMVVNIVDICTRVGITDFALNPLEFDY